MLFDSRSFVLINVLFAVLKKDMDVSLSDYSNSICSRLSLSSSSIPAPSVITASIFPLIDLFMIALDGRIELLFDTDPKPDVAG